MHRLIALLISQGMRVEIQDEGVFYRDPHAYCPYHLCPGKGCDCTGGFYYFKNQFAIRRAEIYFAKGGRR